MRQVDRRTAGVVGAAIRDPGTVFSPSLAGRMFNHRCGSSLSLSITYLRFTVIYTSQMSHFPLDVSKIYHLFSEVLPCPLLQIWNLSIHNLELNIVK